MTIIIRRSWTGQPQYGVGVNPRWIANGLVALFDTRQARELLSGDRATNITSLVSSARDGIAADFSGTANQQYAHRSAFAQIGNLTIVTLLEVDALTNYGAVIAKQLTTTTQTPYELRLGSGSTDGRINLVRAEFSATEAKTASSVLTAGAGPKLLSVTADTAGTSFVYVDGQQFATTSNLTGAPIDNGSSAVWIGRRYDGATQLDGRIYYVALFRRVLSHGEIQSLNVNRWQLFAPRRVAYPISATAAGIYTLSSATYAPGSITATGVTPRVSVAVT